jgi:hypothetical protein
MKNSKRYALLSVLTVLSGVLLFFSCQKEEVLTGKETIVQPKTTSGGGGTSCTVSCFWGTATANCPGGGATCYCEWGSPVTSCGGGSTVAGSFNYTGAQDFETFVNQNQLSPALIQSVQSLQYSFDSGDWNQYVQAQQNYVSTIAGQPQHHQDMIAGWLSSNE